MKAHQNHIDTRVALLEQSIDHINETLNRIDSRLGTLDQKMDNNFSFLRKEMNSNSNELRKEMNSNSNELRKEINEVRKESISQFRWIIGIIIALFGLPIIQNTIIHFWSH